jgi:hypothetical protein
MALNASGPLSLGGATTGQSINLELGVSATALASINSTSFRTLAGVASGQISISSFYGKSNGTRQWMSTTPSSTYPLRNFYDSSGNAYVAYASTSAQPWPVLVRKWNLTNTSQFSNTYTPAYGANTIGGMAFFDTSANMYYLSNDSATHAKAWVTKVNSSGTAQFARGIGTFNTSTWNAGSYASPKALGVSSSAVVLLSNFLGTQIVGYDYCVCPPQPIYESSYQNWLTKITASTGAQQFTYEVYGSAPLGNGMSWQGCAIISTDYFYAFSTLTVSGVGKYAVLAFTPSGTPSVGKYYNVQMTNDSQPRVQPVVDSANQMYDTKIDDTYNWHLIKITNSTVDPVWARTFSFTGAQNGTYYSKCLALDSSNNIYWVGDATYEGNTQSFLVKFNSSGTVLFSQRIKATNPVGGGILPLRVYGIYVDSTTMYLSFNGQAVVSGTTYSSDYNLAVPNDGSAVSTSTTVNYPPTGTAGAVLAISSFSPNVSNNTYTSTAFSVTQQSNSYIYQTLSVTTAASSFQQSVASI